jgi:hypothetical protein
LRELETDRMMILSGLKEIIGYRNGKYASMNRAFYCRSGNG